jgi:deoxyribodipyrimidine photo-lyase
MKKRSMVWFKTDLRMEDNETLLQAIHSGQEVVPVFCLDSNLLGNQGIGPKRMGLHRVKFLLESLSDLDQQLRERGSGLLVVQGDPVHEIPALVKEYGVNQLFSKQEVAPEEKTQDDQIEQKLWKLECIVNRYSTSTLFPAVDLPFRLRDIPEIFTQFRKKVEKECVVRKPLEAPNNMCSPNIKALVLPTLSELGFSDEACTDSITYPFKGGENEGKNRMQKWMVDNKSLFRYKETRNELDGIDYSSRLSPWLAWGCLSPRSIYHEVKKAESQFGSNESSYWLIFELLWRDFFRFMMKKHGAKLFSKNGFNGPLPYEPKHDVAALEQWKYGQTGDELVDACMKELYLTGFMSNRGRQNVASYLIDQLKLDWRIGAAWFEERLIDYDPCSNWGNWAYLAGVGNDPRGKRVFDTKKQAEMYDSSGQFRKKWKEIVLQND